ncbi:MAG: nuclear transport factor 2 family protein [Actinomycetota bacterium]|nr:nuclear transport factor 2 family protein [Actinomycetota bacterium]
MPWRLIALPFIAAVLLALTSCGSGDESPTTQEPTSEEATEGPAEDVEVIRDWSEALTEGDIDAAAEYFAIPSVAENGITVEIETPDDARLFNESLPCGAELESTQAQGEFITATFRLTERPGVPVCPGSGNTAETTFVIKDGAIVEWRRVAVPGPESPSQAT